MKIKKLFSVEMLKSRGSLEFLTRSFAQDAEDRNWSIIKIRLELESTAQQVGAKAVGTRVVGATY